MKSKLESDQLLIEEYQAEYDRWFNILDKYHTNRFSRNYKQYAAYSESLGTTTKISDPVAPELVEKVVQKLFERDPRFFSMARGHNLPREVTDIISAVAEYYWTNPEATQKSGSKRAKLKVLGREFCIVGNTGTETYFDADADAPDFRVIPIEDIIFDPTRSLKNSGVYYVRQYVTLEYLKKNKEIKKNGEVVTGRFKNIDKLEKEVEKDKVITDDPSTNPVDRSGSTIYQDQVGTILLISRYEGDKVCRITNWTTIIEETTDPMGLGEDPLDFSMDIEVPKKPYAYSWLDFINGLTKAKDLMLNQIVDYGAKALNPPLFVDPNIRGIDKATLQNAWRLGGVVMASPQAAQHQAMPPLPRSGFELMNYLQQRSESTSGVGAYLAGVPNQVSDKTRGTKGGIQMMLEQAVTPVHDRQLNIEESIIEPIINKWLKMAASLMGENEVKYVFITGQSPKWVKVTKGLLSGKVRLYDLLVAELINDKQALEIAESMREKGLNPEKEFVFDVDWLVRVETGSMAEVDKEKDLNAFNGFIEKMIELQIPFDREKVIAEMGMKSGLKEPEQYILKQEAGMPPQGGVNSQIPSAPPTPRG